MSAQAVLAGSALLAGTHVLAQQRCDADAPVTAASIERFEDGRDGTVTDRSSKLMWTRCSVGQALTDTACSGKPRAMTWANAKSVATEINASGELFFKDWRVPQVHELATLTDLHCDNPRINLAAFPSTPPVAYWTASTRKPPDSPGFAYALSFGADGVKLVDKEQPALVRLVRSAR